MSRDKQLRGVKLDAVRTKQRLGQALNIKEFAVLAGIAYSVAREWFQLPGFPALCGKVFWEDFVLWRRTRNTRQVSADLATELNPSFVINAPLQLPPRAERILATAK